MNLVMQLKPFLILVGEKAYEAWPTIVALSDKAQELWAKLAPYHPEELSTAIIGLILVFFGGHFFLTIAAAEAFRICGYSQVSTALRKLHANYLVAKAASEKDDLVDDDKDGVADVKQISKDELLNRKAKVVLKAVDPAEVSEAMTGIYTGLFGVIAALKIRFANIITLGASMADVVRPTCEHYLSPLLLSTVSPEYHKWVPFIIQYATRTVAVMLAFAMQRVLASWHSAMRGAQLLLRGLLNYLVRHGHLTSQQVEPMVEGTRSFDVMVMGIGLMGFLWQFSSGYNLPFPLNLLLLPVSMLESTLGFLTA